MRHNTLLLIALASFLSVPLAASDASADERKVVAERAGCSISVGDKDAAGTQLIIADCAWPVAHSKVIPVVKAAETHAFMSSVGESTRLADGRVLQIHKASGITDRQVTLKFTNKDLPDGGFRTSWTRAATQEPLREDMVDVPMNDGAWEVHPDGNGGSKVTYELRYDAGGKIPSWVVRSFQKGGIADLVEEMRAQVEK